MGKYRFKELSFQFEIEKTHRRYLESVFSPVCCSYKVGEASGVGLFKRAILEQEGIEIFMERLWNSSNFRDF